VPRWWDIGLFADPGGRAPPQWTRQQRSRYRSADERTSNWRRSRAANAWRQRNHAHQSPDS
jgi:hypothetical protein